MKKRECPCCGQKPKKKRAEERIAKWLEDARIDRLMVEKLEGLAKARKTEWMKAVNKLEGVADELERAASPTTDAGEQIWVARDKKKARKQLHDARPANVWRRTNLSYTAPKEMEGAASPTTGREVKWDSVVPGLSPEERKLRRVAQKKIYMKAYHARKKAAASAADVGKALSAENKKEAEQELSEASVRKADQLEHQRAYNREYYHRKKGRIKQLRDARLAKNRARKRVGNSATKAVTLQ